MKVAGRAAALAAGLACMAPASLAAADSFNPIRMQVTIASTARRHTRLPITVKVSADAGVLDTRTAPLRVQVKLASECGGTYQYTSGPVLLNKRLKPQPTTGKPYSGVARGSGKPTSYGVKTVCIWLNEEGDDRTFASDQSITVDVDPACTAKAARYDADRRALRRARRHHKGVRAAQRRAARAKRAARRACGKGVPL